MPAHRTIRATVIVALVASLLTTVTPAAHAGVLTISGTVMNPAGTPINGAGVSDGGQSSISGADGTPGHYSLQELGFGTYQITASKQGMTSAIATVQLTATNSSAIRDFTLYYQSTLYLPDKYLSTAAAPDTLQATLKTWTPHPGSCAKITDTRTGATTAMSHTGTEAGQQVWQYTPTLAAQTPEGTFTLTARVDDCTTGTRIDTGAQQLTYVIDNSPPKFDVEGLRPLHLGNTVLTTQSVVATVVDNLSGINVSASSLSLRSLPDGQPEVYPGSSLAWNSADGTLAGPAAAMIAGTNYEASADVFDRAGNSSHATWTFRAISEPLIDAATGALQSVGSNTGLAGTNPDTLRWAFSPRLSVGDRIVHWTQGSAHPGWGLVSTSVQIGAATIKVKRSDGSTQVWPINPYNAGETATYYQQVAYLDPAGGPAKSLLPTLDIRLDSLTVDLPVDVTEADLDLQGATVTTRPGPVCLPPPPNPYLCIPDVLPFHIPIGFAERFLESAGDRPIDTVVGIASKLPNPFDSGGTWHALLPVSQANCYGQNASPGNLCWSPNPLPNTPTPGLVANGNIGYTSASMLLPTDIAEMCKRTSYCASKAGAATVSSADADEHYWDRVDCIDPYDGTDRPYVEYPDEPDPFGRVGREPCTQVLMRTIDDVRSPFGLPNYIYRFSTGLDMEWGFEDGSHDEQGIHWSALMKYENKPVEIRWVTARIPTTWGPPVHSSYSTMGGRYPRTPSNPNPVPYCETWPYAVPNHWETGVTTGYGPFGVGTGGQSPGSTHGWPQWGVYSCPGDSYAARTTRAGLSVYVEQVDRSWPNSTLRTDGMLTATFGHSWQVGNYSFNLIEMADNVSACTPSTGGPISCVRELFFDFFGSNGSHNESWEWTEDRPNAFSYVSNY